MKKILLLFFLVSTTFVGKSQLQLPFPDSTGAWIYYSQWGAPPWEVEIHYLRYYIHGDTTIEGKNYNKLYYDSYSITDSVFSTLKGFFRNDSLKVYFRNYSFDPIWELCDTSTSEFLLYDFGLEVGDTIQSPSGFTGTIVNSIDSIIINDDTLKRWNLQVPVGGGLCYYLDTWIEGIGSTAAFVPCRNCFEGYNFLCSFNRFNINYPVSMSCFVPLGEGDPISKIDVSVYPNPTSGQFNLDFLGNAFKGQVIIQDAMGRLILEKDITQTTTTIDLSKQTKGLYFIRVNDGSTLKLLVE